MMGVIEGAGSEDDRALGGVDLDGGDLEAGKRLAEATAKGSAHAAIEVESLTGFDGVFARAADGVRFEAGGDEVGESVLEVEGWHVRRGA